MIITLIIVGGVVAVAFGIITCVNAMVRADRIATNERMARAEERRHK